MKRVILILLTIGIAFAVLYVFYDANRKIPDTGIGEKWHASDICPRSSALQTGSAGGPWYLTVAPCESFDSERTHTFPYTCSFNELMPSGQAGVNARTVCGLPGIYNVVTRNRGELYVLGGTQSTDRCVADSDVCATGPYVAKLDASTLKIVWRTRIHDAGRNGDWDYPGAIGIHTNGFVYAVNGYTLAKLDPQTGEIVKKIKLPTPEGRPSGDTVYNGFSILSDGNLIMKSLTRKQGSDADSIRALLFHFDHTVPSTIAVIEPENLVRMTSVTVREPVLGRITAGAFNGREYVYVSGFKNIFRYVYAAGTLTPDTTWGPVPYGSDAEKPATAPALLGDYVVVQTNFQLARGPISLTAASQADASRVFRIAPFAGDRMLPGSLQWSLPTVDADTRRIYICDFLEGRLAAVDLDPEKGFFVDWKQSQRSLSFGVLMGSKENRTFVLEDGNFPSLVTVRVVWRDAQTGKELARSPGIPQGAGLPITPGFDGVLYYLSHRGCLTELSLNN